MKRSGAEAITFADVGRFVVNTRRGRLTTAGYLGGAALLGIILGFSHTPQAVVSIVIVLYVAVAVPVILDQARRARRRHDGSPR